jgi:hypothetical protein
MAAAIRCRPIGSMMGRPDMGSVMTRLSSPKTCRTVSSVSTASGVPDM